MTAMKLVACLLQEEGSHRSQLIGVTVTKLKFSPPYKDEAEVVAYFGQARLIKYLDGKMELRDGSAKDQAEAREWMLLFWHEAVVGDDSGRRV